MDFVGQELSQSVAEWFFTQWDSAGRRIGLEDPNSCTHMFGG